MTAAQFDDPFTCIHWIARLHGLAVCVVTLELLGAHRIFSRSGPQSWEIVSQCLPGIKASGLYPLFFSYPAFCGWLAARSAAGAVLFFTPSDPRFAIPSLAVILLVHTLYDIRSLGFVGSVTLQMLGVITGALLLRAFAWDSDLATRAVVIFIGVNAALAYFFSALWKLQDKYWRSGEQIFNVYNNGSLGRASLARFFHERPGLTRVLTWSTIGVELIFPLVLIVGSPACYVFIGWSYCFHVFNWAALGLRGFTLTFAATWPAMIYVSRLFHEWIFR